MALVPLLEESITASLYTILVNLVRLPTLKIKVGDLHVVPTTDAIDMLVDLSSYHRGGEMFHRSLLISNGWTGHDQTYSVTNMQDVVAILQPRSARKRPVKTAKFG